MQGVGMGQGLGQARVRSDFDRRTLRAAILRLGRTSIVRLSVVRQSVGTSARPTSVSGQRMLGAMPPPRGRCMGEPLQ
jgi:hypothetical protein